MNPAQNDTAPDPAGTVKTARIHFVGTLRLNIRLLVVEAKLPTVPSPEVEEAKVRENWLT